MSKSHPGTLNRVASRTTLAASVTLLALFGGFAAGAAHADERSDASCRQETKRVAVWPKAPKAPKVARFEDRQVTICGAKAMSRPAEATAFNSNHSDK